VRLLAVAARARSRLCLAVNFPSSVAVLRKGCSVGQRPASLACWPPALALVRACRSILLCLFVRAAVAVELDGGPPHVQYLCTLRRHTGAVNVVRFSPLVGVWRSGLGCIGKSFGEDERAGRTHHGCLATHSVVAGMGTRTLMLSS